MDLFKNKHLDQNYKNILQKITQFFRVSSSILKQQVY